MILLNQPKRRRTMPYSAWTILPVSMQMIGARRKWSPQTTSGSMASETCQASLPLTKGCWTLLATPHTGAKKWLRLVRHIAGRREDWNGYWIDSMVCKRNIALSLSQMRSMRPITVSMTWMIKWFSKNEIYPLSDEWPGGKLEALFFGMSPFDSG